MIIYDDIKIPEEVACAFIVGFIHKTSDKSNLTDQKISEISERIEFLCPNISEDSRKRIRQAIFNEPDITILTPLTDTTLDEELCSVPS